MESQPYRDPYGEDYSYDDLHQTESVVRERALDRIRAKQRERSKSNLGTSVHSVKSQGEAEISPTYGDHSFMESDHGGIAFSRTVSIDAGSALAREALLQEEDNLSLPPASLTTSHFGAPDGDGEENMNDELDDEVLLTNEDVRAELFEAIPEPYFQSTDFQRVIITDVEEDEMERDTMDACSLLKKCMDIRSKWIAKHPSPQPQDINEHFSNHQDHPHSHHPLNSPPYRKHTLSHNGIESSSSQQSPRPFPAAVHTSQHHHHHNQQQPAEHFRRRGVPPYEIFGTSLPEMIENMRFKMINGIMHVNYVTMKEEHVTVTVTDTTATAAQSDNSLPIFAISEDSTMGLSISYDEGDPPTAGNNNNNQSAHSLTAAAVPPSISPVATATLRKKTVRKPSIFCTEEEDCNLDDAGGYLDWSTRTIYPYFTYQEYWQDIEQVRKAIYSGPCISFAFKRLELLSSRFNLHTLLNDRRELEAQKAVPHRDFYNVRKVDTHVHHSACMNQKHMLRFIKHKLKSTPNEAVIFRDGRFLTLGEVFKSLNLTAYDLSIDTLDMHANNTFRRFDRFNLKYNPAGQSRLREIFLKTDNIIGGKFLAEITREVMNDLEASKYQLVEWRISIYGRKASEWSSLSRWFYIHRLAHNNVRWCIQTPRLYDAYKRSGEITHFGQMLSNIFAPLFAVSIDPASNPPMHYFLQTVVAFDSVDDESRPELEFMNSSTPAPDQWQGKNNPPYSYWMYYMYSNLQVLNQLRASRGLNTFQFRPHCGEAGDVDHLVATYITAHQINHGILLRKNAALHYLYYLSQIGIAMSPLSNNKLFLDYNKNPFPKYFQQGLNVSLSTDDPLMLHYTKDALLEEYSVAAQVWKLSSTDQCEIARNSVLQSGWERRFKLHFLGKDCTDIRETNVPVIRLMYRQETLQHEIENICKHTQKIGGKK